MSNIALRIPVSALVAVLAFTASVPSGTVFDGVASAADAPAQPDVFSHQKAYLDNVKAVCDVGPWAGGESVITAASVTYPDFESAMADRSYRAAIEAVGGDKTGIEDLIAKSKEPGTPFQMGTDVKLASEVYKERMNGIFACAQINFKIRTHENLLKTIKGEKADSGNTAKKLEEQTKKLRLELTRRHCADRTSTDGKGNVMMKGMVLNQTAKEYCNYRHYLQYLKSNAQNRISSFVTAEEKRRSDGAAKSPEAGSKALGSAEEAGIAVANLTVSIGQEIDHTREVFPQSMLAYKEFERTYASHVVMLFVLEDYMLLRDTLKKVMNPLGQVIYKASNAESPKSP